MTAPKPREFWIASYDSEYAYWDTCISANPKHELTRAIHVIEAAYVHRLERALEIARVGLTRLIDNNDCDTYYAREALKQIDGVLGERIDKWEK